MPLQVVTKWFSGGTCGGYTFYLSQEQNQWCCDLMLMLMTSGHSSRRMCWNTLYIYEIGSGMSMNWIGCLNHHLQMQARNQVNCLLLLPLPSARELHVYDL
jgi:hypothetical protein